MVQHQCIVVTVWADISSIDVTGVEQIVESSYKSVGTFGCLHTVLHDDVALFILSEQRKRQYHQQTNYKFFHTILISS